MNVWNKVWEHDSYSVPKLRKIKAKYKVDSFSKDLDINETTVCVDIGCGGGYVAKEIYNRYNCFVYGCDSSTSAISYAKKHNSFDKCDYFLSPANSIKLPDETADIVLCVGVLEHISDINSALSEIHRILKNNGKLIIISSNYYSFIFADRILKQTFNQWKYGYQKNWRPIKLKKELDKCGFLVKKSTIIQGFGDFDKINNADKIINKIFPFWGRYIQLLGEKK